MIHYRIPRIRVKYYDSALGAGALGALGKVLTAEGSLIQGFFRYVNVVSIPKARWRAVRGLALSIPYFGIVFHALFY